jgi:hypothetical protein
MDSQVQQILAKLPAEQTEGLHVRRHRNRAGFKVGAEGRMRH